MSTVASFCRNCGKALTDEERAAENAAYCSSCAPAVAPPTPAPTPSASYPPPLPPPPSVPNPDVSPGIAFLLGLLPGVGAIYNAQYAKGLVHAFIFGLLISLLDTAPHGAGPLLAPLLAGFYFYMPFEAYHTARKRQLGQRVDEFSSLVSLRRAGGSVAGPLVLICLGVLFLLNNLDILRFSQVIRFWPVLLILLGVIMLRERLTGVRHGTD